MKEKLFNATINTTITAERTQHSSIYFEWGLLWRHMILINTFFFKPLCLDWVRQQHSSLNCSLNWGYDLAEYIIDITIYMTYLQNCNRFLSRVLLVGLEPRSAVLINNHSPLDHRDAGYDLVEGYNWHYNSDYIVMFLKLHFHGEIPRWEFNSCL